MGQRALHLVAPTIVDVWNSVWKIILQHFGNRQLRRGGNGSGKRDLFRLPHLGPWFDVLLHRIFLSLSPLF